jgi:hypothetical protein
VVRSTEPIQCAKCIANEQKNEREAEQDSHGHILFLSTPTNKHPKPGSKMLGKQDLNRRAQVLLPSFRLLRGGSCRSLSHFFGAGSERGEARAAVKRFEVVILIDAKVREWGKSVVNSLAQE